MQRALHADFDVIEIDEDGDLHFLFHLLSYRALGGRTHSRRVRLTCESVMCALGPTSVRRRTARFVPHA
jgi:hypothetical protein